MGTPTALPIVLSSWFLPIVLVLVQAFLVRNSCDLRVPEYPEPQCQHTRGVFGYSPDMPL